MLKECLIMQSALALATSWLSYKPQKKIISRQKNLSVSHLHFNVSHFFSKALKYFLNKTAAKRNRNCKYKLFSWTDFHSEVSRSLWCMMISGCVNLYCPLVAHMIVMSIEEEQTSTWVISYCPLVEEGKKTLFAPHHLKWEWGLCEWSPPPFCCLHLHLKF